MLFFRACFFHSVDFITSTGLFTALFQWADSVIDSFQWHVASVGENGQEVHGSAVWVVLKGLGGDWQTGNTGWVKGHLAPWVPSRETGSRARGRFTWKWLRLTCFELKKTKKKCRWMFHWMGGAQQCLCWWKQRVDGVCVRVLRLTNKHPFITCISQNSKWS